MRRFALAVPLALALAPAVLAEVPRGPWAGYRPASFLKAKAVPVAKPKKPKPPKPPRGPWAGFKPGSFVKTTTVTVVKVGHHKVQTVTDITQTVMEVHGDRAVIETNATMDGVPRPARTRAQVSLKEPLPAPASPGRKAGKKALTVAGRLLRCDWTESESDMAGERTMVRTWTSPEVPGGIVRKLSRNGLMESTMEVVAFEAK
jgi:hypothetical protein